MPNVTGPSSIKRTPAGFLKKRSFLVFFQHLVEFRRILCFDQHQCAVIRQTFRDPLVAVIVPGDQIAPPLVRRLVPDNHADESFFCWGEMEMRLFFIAEVGKTGEKNQPRPALAHVSWKLRQRPTGDTGKVRTTANTIRWHARTYWPPFARYAQGSARPRPP